MKDHPGAIIAESIYYVVSDGNFEEMIVKRILQTSTETERYPVVVELILLQQQKHWLIMFFTSSNCVCEEQGCRKRTKHDSNTQFVPHSLTFFVLTLLLVQNRLVSSDSV